MKTTKRLVGLLLALVMVLGMLPVSVFAEIDSTLVTDGNYTYSVDTDNDEYLEVSIPNAASVTMLQSSTVARIMRSPWRFLKTQLPCVWRLLRLAIISA